MAKPRLTPEQLQLVDAKCDQFENHWQIGDPVAIEVLLEDISTELAPLLLRELLLLEIELRIARDERPTPDEYNARFPANASTVDEVFQRHGPRERPAGFVGEEGASADLRQLSDSVSLKSPISGSGSSQLQVRCPSCQTTIQVAMDTELTDLTCPQCRTHFSLVDSNQHAAQESALARMGRFELIARIGIGGFGSVWKARDVELDRVVALKIPRHDVITAEEQDKFLREARTAAQLRHPGIVAVYEVGRDGDVIYIVSDIVHGMTLRDWLLDQRLTCRESAELCVKIANALHYAHEQGVVHRDLKPANIMIDGDGQPHLMDFGLARREVGEVTMTIEGQILGTPAYMSPEQAQGEAHLADRRSDIYSLGVIVFQLITGELPFRGNARMLLHQVIHEEPPSPKKFSSHIPRDIETITLKCLEKEPARRYSTAQELAAELQRYLRSEPILARPISQLERCWRWSQRHPAIVAAVASAVALIITLGVGVAMIYSAKQSADANRRLAERKEATVRRTLHFLQQLFRTSDPVFGSAVGWRANGDAAQVPLNEILHRAAPAVLSEISQDEPAVAVEVLCTLGGIYRSVGVYDGAEQLLAHARRIAQQFEPASVALVEFNWGWLQHDLGKYEAASASYDRAWNLRRELYGAKSLEVAEVDFNRAWLLADLKHPLEAIRLFRLVLDIRRARLKDDAFEVQATALALKVLLMSQNKHEDAFLVEALVGNKKDELTLMVNAVAHAGKLRAEQKRSEALKEYESLYRRLKVKLNPGHPLLVYFQVDLAGLNKELGNNEQAEELMREAINGSKSLFDSNPKLILPLMEFARNLAARGDVEEAGRLYQRALQVAQGRDQVLENQIRQALAELPDKSKSDAAPK